MKHKDLVKRNIDQLNSMKLHNADVNDLISTAQFDVNLITPDNIEITYSNTDILSRYMAAILCADGPIITFPFNNMNKLKNRIRYCCDIYEFVGYLIAEVVNGNK